MNKVYNTVWNESTGMWVVTSELTRKGGQRPRQIKRTALAGLIAGLLLPTMPAQAAYENQTVNSGSELRVYKGNSATNTTVNGGALYLSGGDSMGTVVNGGREHVMNGGTATGTVVNSGGGRMSAPEVTLSIPPLIVAAGCLRMRGIQPVQPLTATGDCRLAVVPS